MIHKTTKHNKSLDSRATSLDELAVILVSSDTCIITCLRAHFQHFVAHVTTLLRGVVLRTLRYTRSCLADLGRGQFEVVTRSAA